MNSKKLLSIKIPMSTGWLLGECAEFRGKQELWIRQKPDLIERLREEAIIQSVESSNRIEGVVVSTERLLPLVLGRARPRDRSEEEVTGYRKALQLIFKQTPTGELTPEIIQRLHALCMGPQCWDAGAWKTRDNEIIQIRDDGSRHVRFRPTSAKDTPSSMQELCDNLNALLVTPEFPGLLAAATTIFDFLCIHPFRDGNGQVSRLLTTWLLERTGFQVGRFISIERRVEVEKAEYYEVLERCSRNWHESKNDIVPWWNFLLGVLRQSYRDFERKVENAQESASRSEIIRGYVLSLTSDFRTKAIAEKFPDVSEHLIRKILQELKGEGRVVVIGRGPGARWKVR